MKYLLFILLSLPLFAAAQYVPNAGAYQWKGGKFTNSLQPPSATASPVTATNAPDSNYAALYYNKTDTTWYQFNPVSKLWSPFAGKIEIGTGDSIFISSIDSIFITNTDSIFIVSGNDTIYIGDGPGPYASLYSGFGINIFDSSYNPTGADAIIAVDTAGLASWVVNIVQGDTTIINNTDSIIAEFYVDTLANAPPASPVEGYKVLIGTSPTGDFADHENEIAERVGSVWTFTAPEPNDVAIVDNADIYASYQWNGTRWNIVTIVWRTNGNKGLGNNSFIGTKDKKPWYLKAWNKTVLKIDTTRDAYWAKYAGLENEPLFFRPGINGKQDTGRFRLPVYDSPAIPDSIAYIEDGQIKYGLHEGGGGGSAAGNYGNIQINRNNTFSTPASDTLSFNDETLNIKGGIFATNDVITGEEDASTGAILGHDGRLAIKTVNDFFNIRGNNITMGRDLEAPDANGTLAESVTVNSSTYHADATGNIDLGTIGGGGSSIALPAGQIARGTGTGIYADSFFVTDTTKHWISINRQTPNYVLDIYPTFPGTLEATNGSSAIIGTGTRFLSNFKKGDTIVIAAVNYIVLTVNNNFSLNLSTNYSGATSSGLSYYAKNENGLFSLRENSRIYSGGYALSRWGGNLANTSFGLNAMAIDSLSSFNSAFGQDALRINTTGNNNTAIGYQTLYANTTGSSNTALGRTALYANTTGSSNTALGFNAMYGLTTGGSNVAIGNLAMQNNNGSNTVAIGISAGSNASSSSGVYIGASSGVGASGSSNVSIGSSSLSGGASGAQNVGIGSLSLRANTSGTQNVGIGYRALDSSISGNNNVAIGGNSLYRNRGGNNVAIGVNALSNYVTGNNNVAIGYNRLVQGNLSNTANIVGAIWVIDVVAPSIPDSTASTTAKTGINTTTPAYTLDVNGGIGTTRPMAATGSGTPSYTAGTGAGTGPTVSITGNDAAGYITITTGTTPTASGNIVTVTFATALTNTPKSIQLTPADEAAATELIKFYVDQATASTTAWVIKNTASALTASTTYKFYYHVTQ